jgi:DNA repair protein RadD
MTVISLWPHQTESVILLRQSISAGKKRPMLQVPTGGGKTRTAGAIIHSARQRGNRVLFIVDAISLIDQTVQAFYDLGLHDIGVIQADHVMTDWSKPIQIASVQTLQRRGMPDMDMAIVDEAHVRNQWLEEQLSSGDWAGRPVIGLSATPWSKGLGLVYDNLIAPVSMRGLIDQGKLLDFRVFAPSHPDLTGVEVTGGDYNGKQLGDRMDAPGLIADIVSTWLRLGEDRPTLCYCVDRAHAKKMQERFVAAGVAAEYIDMNTDGSERRKIQRRLESGETKVVCNIATLTKGIDWKIGCIIIARPTKSKMLHVQIAGRVIRANSGYPDGLVLDHSDNMLRLGLPPDIGSMPLCKAKKGERKNERADPLPKECPSCGFLKAPKIRECPVCKFVPEVKSDLEEEDGELVQIGGKKAVATAEEKQRWYSGLRFIQAQRGYKDGWCSNQYREKFGVWPKGLSNIPSPPAPDIENFVRSKLIRFAKARKAA